MRIKKNWWIVLLGLLMGVSGLFIVGQADENIATNSGYYNPYYATPGYYSGFTVGGQPGAPGTISSNSSYPAIQSIVANNTVQYKGTLATWNVITKNTTKLVVTYNSAAFKFDENIPINNITLDVMDGKSVK